MLSRGTLVTVPLPFGVKRVALSEASSHRAGRELSSMDLVHRLRAQASAP